MKRGNYAGAAKVAQGSREILMGAGALFLWSEGCSLVAAAYDRRFQ